MKRPNETKKADLQMKVLMITPFYYPIVGGSETQIENISLKLNEAGITADIMTFNFARALKPLTYEKTEKMNGINVIRIPAFNFLPRQLHHNKINFMVNIVPRRFTQKLREYDILHFHNETDLSFPLFSYTVDKPKVFHLRCLSVTYPIFKRNFVCKWLLKKLADIYIAQSKYVSQLLIDLGIPSAKIKIVPNGINVSLFQPEKHEKIENLILFVGRILESKGLHLLLKSLELIREPVQLVIIGPLAGESSYHEKIFRLVAKINEKTVHKVTYVGPKQPKEIIKYYQRASIVVVPSLAESFGNVILEALACGTPVIASNVGGIPEIIKQNENGILVPPNNVDKLADAIYYLLDNDDVRTKLGEEGRRFVVENFSSDIMIEKIIGAYKEITVN
jgi:glycosyltransferase involved in cell wall biosynthesis